MFWAIFWIDREMVHPAELDQYIPSILNHLYHTAPIVLSFLEALTVFHRYPSNPSAVLAVFLVSTAYIVWIVWVFTRASIWPYGFFEVMPLPVIPLFFLFSFLVCLGFYFLGKLCCYLRWKGNKLWGSDDRDGTLWLLAAIMDDHSSNLPSPPSWPLIIMITFPLAERHDLMTEMGL